MCLCVNQLAQIGIVDIETCNPACRDLLMNFDHKPKTKVLERSDIICTCAARIEAEFGNVGILEPLKKGMLIDKISLSVQSTYSRLKRR